MPRPPRSDRRDRRCDRDRRDPNSLAEAGRRRALDTAMRRRRDAKAAALAARDRLVRIRAATASTLQLEFDDNRLLPLLFGEHDRHLARIEQRARRVARHARQPLAISGTPDVASIAPRDADALYQRLKRGQPVGSRRGRRGAALRARDATGEPRLFAARAATARRSAPSSGTIAPRSAGPGALHRGAAARRSRLRRRPRRHRQDLSRRCRRRRDAAKGRGRPHRAVAPGGRGRRAARLPARRHAREGRSLSPPAL